MPSSEVPLISPSAETRFVLEEAAMPNAFLAAATELGYIHQCTDEAALTARLDFGTVTDYIGYDCTGGSLHIFSLLLIILLRLYLRSGHNPIVPMGSGTTRIVDPSDNDERRPLPT